jgi:PadR family transcriptional regulator, regulatory protein PadR
MVCKERHGGFLRSQTLKGHLDMLLLAALKDDPAHGYAVLERLRMRSEGVFDLSEGTIYPALHRLEAARLIKSRRVMHDGRGRRVYSLTDRGARTLAEYREEWRQFSAGVTRIVEGTG